MNPPAISIDSRTLRPGDLYIALRGETHDGHDFVAAALERGASAAMVEEASVGRIPEILHSRLQVVPDTLRAFQDLAHQARMKWGKTVVAITGSAGKTTTKEMIAAVLATRRNVLKSQGNLNNHFGVPLTLLRLRPEHDVAVVEMGMNHAGEIARLAEIAAPNIGVFTNVGTAHIGHFDSIEAVAEAKRELALAIPAGGTLVLNAADPRVARFGDGLPATVVTYCAPRATANRAAAIATGGLFGIGVDDATAALDAMPALAGRGEILSRRGLTIINDCYNANPEAMEFMLETLRGLPGRRYIAVLGEMRELGRQSEALHRQVGAAAAALPNLDALVGVGGDARFLLDEARRRGFSGVARFFATALEARDGLASLLQPGDVVLFKASHSIHLEDAIPNP
ncbi:MAG TPA: UDP-N-acetylmuramoyl-tripeptide--D-alanyl-D-alanine ligase [Terriglobales bacterium]|nr:UDP-N-acetylmuramoyl-tripeptide--D-alanyl-D-alanine ligase [Terriglobales bacterium]